MTPGLPDSCPFIAGSMLADSRFFVGRQEELNSLNSRLTAAQPISVNVVGKHKIGKSSLVYHFYQTWNTYQLSSRPQPKPLFQRLLPIFQRLLPRRQRQPTNPNPYEVIHLDLQQAECQTENSLYLAIAEKLRQQPGIASQPDLFKMLSAPKLDRPAFSRVIKKFKDYQILPVLCLDKFEALFQNPQEFNNGFYDNFHSLMNNRYLMLVVVTVKTLDIYSQEHQLTSSFFNIGHVLRLEEFSEAEAQELVQLPASKSTGAAPYLHPDQQKLALAWGKQEPFLLQLAGFCLWEARQQNQDSDWAKAQFEEQASFFQDSPVTEPPPQALSTNLLIKSWGLVFRSISRVGQIAKNIGAALGKSGEFFVGTVVVVAVILVLTKTIPWEKFSDFLLELFKKVIGK